MNNGKIITNNEELNVGARPEEIPVRHDTTVPKKINKNRITPVGAGLVSAQENKYKTNTTHVGGVLLARPLRNTHQTNTTQNGITLMTLVITIIIMLILAGVVLNFTIGERGIFNTAKSTKDIQRIAEYKDDVEISRTGVAVNNLGKVTLDNLIEEIYKDKIVPEGSIIKLDETRGKMTTKEGYVFIITVDGIEYIGKGEEVPTPPNLQEGDITYSIKPEGWTKDKVKVKLEVNKGEKFRLQYSLDKTTWKDYINEIELEENKTIYACVRNAIGEQGKFASIKVSNIDKLEPEDFTPSIKNTSNSIEIDASEAKDKEANEKYGKSGIKEIWYSKDNGATWQTNENKKSTTYKYEGLIQNTKYNIKVKVIDEAENETTTEVQEVTTGTVAVATGNITINAPTWNKDTHKASVTITKGSSVSSSLSIQYQVATKVENLTEAGWTTGTSVTNINLNDTVYARLWDGTNGGSYTSLKIVETTAPTVTVNITGTSTNSITASVSASDNQAGMPTSPTYTFYIKKTSEADSAYVQKQSNTSTTYTFTGLAQNTSYTVKVTTKDIAENTGIGTKAGTTGTVAASSGNITFTQSTTNWTNGNVTVTGTSKVAGYKVQLSTSTTFPNSATEVKSVTVSSNQTVYARLVDSTNQANGYATHKVTNIDKTPPSVPGIKYNGGANTCSWKNDYNITLSSTDSQSGIAYYESDGNNDGAADFTTGSSVIPFNGFNCHTQRFRAVDNAGNRSAWTDGQHIHMDTEAPNAFTISVTDVTSQGFKINVNATGDNASGINRYDYVINGSGFYPGNVTSYQFSEYTIGKTYSIYVVAYDNAGWPGNSRVSNTITFSIPSVTVTASSGSGNPLNGGNWNAGTYSGTFNLSLSSPAKISGMIIRMGGLPADSMIDCYCSWNGTRVHHGGLIAYHDYNLDWKGTYDNISLEFTSNQTWIDIESLIIKFDI